jgi:hypothetical protein
MIISFLPSSSREFLSDNDIKLPSTAILLKPPMFNYISFCKFPTSCIVANIARSVIKETSYNSLILKSKSYLLEQEIYKLFVNQCKDLKKLWLETPHTLSSFPGASNCFSKLYDLDIDTDYVTSGALYEMAQICKDLNKLTIRDCFRDLPGLISLIDAQRNLTTVTLSYYGNDKRKAHQKLREANCEELGKALARKSNTIKNLHIGSISTILPLPPLFLTSLINLKLLSVHTVTGDEPKSDHIKDIKEIQKYFEISEFPALKYLGVFKLPCFKELAMLIDKTKGNILSVLIEDISYENKAQNTGMLIKAISNNCPNIIALSTYLKPKDFIHVKSLLINCKHLTYISFNGWNNFDVNNENYIGDELLDNILINFPSTLICVKISGCWKYSIDAFKRFFEGFRGRTFPTSFGYIGSMCTKEHKAIIKKYIEEGVIVIETDNWRGYETWKTWD